MSRVRIPGQGRRGHLAMLLFSALVAGSFSLGGLVAELIQPAALNALRFGIAAALIGVACLATTGLPARAFAAPWRFLVLGGLFAVYFVTMFEGLKTAPPVSVAAVFTLTPLMAAGFGWLLQRQRMTARVALALALGAAGALWVIFRGDRTAMAGVHIGRGEAIFFCGCVAHAAYTPMVPRLNRGESPVYSTFGMLVAAALLLCLYGWRDIAATEWTALPRIVWITLAYLSVIASAVTFVLVQYAALRLPAAKVMAYTYLVPSWVIAWEVALGRPMPPAMALAGVGLTALSLALLLEGE